LLAYKVLIDETEYPTERIIKPEMAKFQGPALILYNDAVFNQKDFDSLCRLGQSEKAKENTKIGQFGLGFNCCYHVTDLPSLVSKQFLVMFDPATGNLPNVTSGEPGLRIDFVKYKFAKQFPDQVYL
jgi:sacsin